MNLLQIDTSAFARQKKRRSLKKPAFVAAQHRQLLMISPGPFMSGAVRSESKESLFFRQLSISSKGPFLQGVPCNVLLHPVKVA